MPSYVMDSIVTRNAKPQPSTGPVEQAVQEFIAKHLPAKGEKERIRFQLSRGETLTLLDAVSVTGYTFQGAHTTPWAPPEQIEGAPAHPSADICAWGRVTGFILTGWSSKEALSSLPTPWREIIAPCVGIAPEERSDARRIVGHMADWPN